MRILLAIAALLATEPMTGVWTVKGKVDGFGFTLWCDLKQAGPALTGVCRDNGPKGKAHPLKAGSYVNGDRVRFIYESNYLITKFDAVYEGVLSGDKIEGTANADGHAGPMTAVKAATPAP